MSLYHCYYETLALYCYVFCICYNGHTFSVLHSLAKFTRKAVNIKISIQFSGDKNVDVILHCMTTGHIKQIYNHAYEIHLICHKMHEYIVCAICKCIKFYSTCWFIDQYSYILASSQVHWHNYYDSIFNSFMDHIKLICL